MRLNSSLTQTCALVFSIIIAIAVGVTFGDSASNHPTYLPPGIQMAHKDLLANDWWFNNAIHYHLAFNLLVFILVKLDVLTWGSALINICVVTLGLHFIYLCLYRQNRKYSFIGIATIYGLYFLSNGFNCVASTYLFTTGLQASNISSAASLAATYFFLGRRYWICGLCLAWASIIHVNFLLVNLPSFGVAYILLHTEQLKKLAEIKLAVIKPIICLLAPSVLCLLIYFPPILQVWQQSENIESKQVASAVFFHFAVPHHYLPNSYLQDFIGLLGWHLLGFSFVVIFPNFKPLKSLFIAQVVIIWLATALTTWVFVPAVSRLFFWRLAPFSILLSCLLVYCGLSVLYQKPSLKVGKHQLTVATILAFSGSFLVLRLQAYYYNLNELHVILYAICLLSIPTLLWFKRRPLNLQRLRATNQPQRLYLTIAIIFALVSFYASFDEENYSLVYLTQSERDKRQLYSFVKQHTPTHSLVLIPPSLDGFRLFSERSVVVDFKALPFGEKALIEWYRRLSDISGLEKPQNFAHVTAGFRAISPVRLRHLQRTYGFSYLVLTEGQVNDLPGWKTLYENGGYRLLTTQNETEHTNTE